MKTSLIELSDTSFLIYVRIDSKDRFINLEIVLKHLLNHFRTKIHLLEVDIEPKISLQFIQRYNLEYEFIEDNRDLFHTTKYRNYLISKCKTPYFFICDADIIVSPKAIIQSIEYLISSSNKCLIYPYNGMFYNVSKKIRDQYVNILNYDLLHELNKEHSLWFNHSVGGIFGGKTSSFLYYKMDNEKILGWGPDDKERYYRLKKAGFSIFRIDTPLYHLYHERNVNSNPFNYLIEEKNKKEYLKVFSKKM